MTFMDRALYRTDGLMKQHTLVDEKHPNSCYGLHILLLEEAKRCDLDPLEHNWLLELKDDRRGTSRNTSHSTSGISSSKNIGALGQQDQFTTFSQHYLRHHAHNG